MDIYIKEEKKRYIKVKTILEVGIALCWLSVLASFILYFILYSCVPRTPTTSHSVEMCEHGTYFYITPTQSFLFHFMLIGGFLGMVILFLASISLRTMKYHIKWGLLFLEVLITGGILLVFIFTIQLIGVIAMFFANAQPEVSPLRFWLLPVIAFPLWLIAIILGFRAWSFVLKKLTGKKSLFDEHNSKNHNVI